MHWLVWPNVLKIPIIIWIRRLPAISPTVHVVCFRVDCFVTFQILRWLQRSNFYFYFFMRMWLVRRVHSRFILIDQNFHAKSHSRTQQQKYLNQNQGQWNWTKKQIKERLQHQLVSSASFSEFLLLRTL